MKLRNRLLALALGLCMIPTLCACGGKSDDDTMDAEELEEELTEILLGESKEEYEDFLFGDDEDEDSGEDTYDDVYEDASFVGEDASAAETTYTITSGDPFSEGLAWVEYQDNNGTVYTGAIDKTGTVKFCVQGEAECSGFYNGLAYLRTDNGLLLVDSDGNVVRDYSDVLADHTLVSYGGGYVVVSQEENDPLAGTSFIYTVIDTAGNETVVDYQFAEEGYVEDGVFSLKSSDYYVAETGEVYGKSTLTAAGIECDYIECSDGYCLAWNYDNSVSSQIYYVKQGTDQVLAISVGDVVEASSLTNSADYSYEIEYMYYFVDGLVTMRLETFDYDYDYVCIDLANGRVLDYQGQYAELFNGKTARAGDGYAMLLYGNDNQYYILFVDQNMNETSDPICIGSYDFMFEGDYLIADDGIWDLQGNQVSDGSFANDLLGLLIDDGEINDGVIHTSGKFYYTYDGELLFEEIDYSQATLIA